MTRRGVSISFLLNAEFVFSQLPESARCLASLASTSERQHEGTLLDSYDCCSYGRAGVRRGEDVGGTGVM
jgi:hypothetical protein